MRITITKGKKSVTVEQGRPNDEYCLYNDLKELALELFNNL